MTSRRVEESSTWTPASVIRRTRRFDVAVLTAVEATTTPTAPGASEYAPGHQTTTGAAKTKKKPCEEEDRLDAGNSVGPFFRSTYRRCKQQNNQVRNSGWQSICLAESQRKQAGEEQDKTGNGHGQKTV